MAKAGGISVSGNLKHPMNNTGHGRIHHGSHHLREAARPRAACPRIPDYGS